MGNVFTVPVRQRRGAEGATSEVEEKVQYFIGKTPFATPLPTPVSGNTFRA